MSWPSLDRRKAALVAKRDLRDAISELRLLAAMIALTLAVPIGSAAGIRGLAYFGGGTAWPLKHLWARESARPWKFCSPLL